MISIIIVNYNTKKFTLQCINSIIKNTLCDYEIIIADNSDKKDQIVTLNNPKINVIKIKNKGFANACNVAVKSSNADYYLFLNPDTIIKDNAIGRCLDFIKSRTAIGALGCKIVGADGKIDHSCKRGMPTPFASACYMSGISKLFPASKILSSYQMTYASSDTILSVKALSGAFMIVKSDIFKKINGFDENFFMYGEDIDLCVRIKECGYSVIYYPYTKIVHLKGKSGMSSKNAFVIKSFYHSMQLFYDKHFWYYCKLIKYIIKSAIKIKMLMSLINAKIHEFLPFCG